MHRFAAVVILSACTGAPKVPAVLATVAPGSSDTAIPCTGTLVFQLDTVPAEISLQQPDWYEQGAHFLSDTFQADFGVSRDPFSPCVLLQPGTITIDLTPLGCVVNAARVTVTDSCGAACTTATALVAGSAVASSANGVSETPETLRLTPAGGLEGVRVESLDGALCGLEIDLAP